MGNQKYRGQEAGIFLEYFKILENNLVHIVQTLIKKRKLCFETVGDSDVGGLQRGREGEIILAKKQQKVLVFGLTGI